MRNQFGHEILLVVTCWNWSWVGEGAKMMMAELLHVKGNVLV